MPFIPHTQAEIDEMLATIGVAQLQDLFAEIPPPLMHSSLPDLPEGMTEMEVTRLFQQRVQQNQCYKNFLGAGAYEHHIPAAVWDIAMRGEYLTAYTPYQAEASQGTLQLIWEYQTMMASLMGLAVSNASLYDGATALTEAILMAYRLKQTAKKRLAAKSHSNEKMTVWVPHNIHPLYRQVLKTLLVNQSIELLDIPFQQQSGTLSVEILENNKNHPCDVLVLSQPNFFGCLEMVDALTDWGHAQGAIVIGLVNPMAMAWLKPPGQWGTLGADIACGEGQPLGIPLASGGPYFGFICCRLEYVRQLPGRVVGRTQDRQGNPGFTLTLQAREQHIRREKATSNICTNQGLLVVAATIYMSLLGPKGLKQLAQQCYQRAQFLRQQLETLSEAKIVFSGPCFHELVLQLPVASQRVLTLMEEKGFLAGLALEPYFPSLNNTLLLCVTETKSSEDILEYVAYLRQIIDRLMSKE